MVAAACMVLYGYDASVFNACQNSKHWVAYFDHPVRTPKHKIDRLHAANGN